MKRKLGNRFAGLGAKGYDVVSYFTDGKPGFIAKADKNWPKLDR